MSGDQDRELARERNAHRRLPVDALARVDPAEMVRLLGQALVQTDSARPGFCYHAVRKEFVQLLASSTFPPPLPPPVSSGSNNNTITTITATTTNNNNSSSSNSSGIAYPGPVTYGMLCVLSMLQPSGGEEGGGHVAHGDTLLHLVLAALEGAMGEKEGADAEGAADEAAATAATAVPALSGAATAVAAAAAGGGVAFGAVSDEVIAKRLACGMFWGAMRSAQEAKREARVKKPGKEPQGKKRRAVATTAEDEAGPAAAPAAAPPPSATPAAPAAPAAAPSAAPSAASSEAAAAAAGAALLDVLSSHSLIDTSSISSSIVSGSGSTGVGAWDFSCLRPRVLVRLLAVANVSLQDLDLYVSTMGLVPPLARVQGDGGAWEGAGAGAESGEPAAAAADPAAAAPVSPKTVPVETPSPSSPALTEVRAYLRLLVSRKAYPAAVGLMKQLPMSEERSGEFLLDMVERGQVELAADWAKYLGGDMCRALIRACMQRDLYKAAYKVVVRCEMKEEFPNAWTEYRKRRSSPTRGPSTGRAYGAANDLRLLARSHRAALPAVSTCHPVLDLQPLVSLLWPLSGQDTPKGGLKGVVRSVFGRRMSARVQMSDWEARPLSAAQVEYAGLDAMVLPHIFDRCVRVACRHGAESVVASCKLQAVFADGSSDRVSGANCGGSSGGSSGGSGSSGSSGGSGTSSSSSSGSSSGGSSGRNSGDSSSGSSNSSNSGSSSGSNSSSGSSGSSDSSSSRNSGREDAEGRGGDGGAAAAAAPASPPPVPAPPPAAEPPSTAAAAAAAAGGGVEVIPLVCVAVTHSAPPIPGTVKSKVQEWQQARALPIPAYSTVNVATHWLHDALPSILHVSHSPTLQPPVKMVPPVGFYSSSSSSGDGSRSCSGVTVHHEAQERVAGQRAVGVEQRQRTVAAAAAEATRAGEAGEAGKARGAEAGRQTEEEGRGGVETAANPTGQHDLWWGNGPSAPFPFFVSQVRIQVPRQALAGASAAALPEVLPGSAAGALLGGRMTESEGDAGKEHEKEREREREEWGWGRFMGLPAGAAKEAENRAAFAALQALVGREEAEFLAFGDLLRSHGMAAVALRAPPRLAPDLIITIVPAASTVNLNAIAAHFSLPPRCCCCSVQILETLSM
ncbi:unnamed protein product [Closterium sp. NIES-53]